MTPDAKPESVTLDDILAARERIRHEVHLTPLISSAALTSSTNSRAFLKAENFQKTGSFKVRGALNAMAQLSPEQRLAGVATFSAGNHGQGLAYAARKHGVHCTVFMATTAVPSKVDAIRSYGADVRQFPDIQVAFDEMSALEADQGVTVVLPFADPAIISGQGSVGLEVLEQKPEVEQVVVPIGGGGLMSGMAIALKTQRPDIRLVGVCAHGASAVSDSLAAGRPVRPQSLHTIADGLAAPFTSQINLDIISEHVDDVITVTDDEMVAAMRFLLERMKVLVEPAGAAAVAALQTGKAAIPVGAVTVAVLSGGNVDIGKLKALI